MKCIKFFAMLLIVIGALNWGLIGFFHYNLIADLFGGEMSTGARVVFDLIGIAGLIGLWCLISRCCRRGCCKCGDSNCKCGSSCNCGSNCKCCKKD